VKTYKIGDSDKERKGFGAERYKHLQICFTHSQPPTHKYKYKERERRRERDKREREREDWTFDISINWMIFFW